MLKISYAGCLGLSPAILAKFTLEMRVAAQNRAKNSLKTPFGKVQGRLRSSMLINLKSIVTSACYDKQHVCAYLQPCSPYTR